MDWRRLLTNSVTLSHTMRAIAYPSSSEGLARLSSAYHCVLHPLQHRLNFKT